MLYRKVPKYILGTLLSYASLFNGCQQAGLNIGEEDMVQSKPAAKMKQDAQASAIHKSPGAELAVTSAYDTSPEDKQVAIASSKAVTKRPSTEQPSEEASLNNAKRAKKEEEIPGHKAWFTAFIQAVKRIKPRNLRLSDGSVELAGGNAVPDRRPVPKYSAKSFMVAVLINPFTVGMMVHAHSGKYSIL